MVQATLASMRHYCPNVPICLVVDGDFDVSDLERDYWVIPLRVSDLPSAEMRELVAGNPRAKLSAMWEGPFEHFVWLDSDAMVWGDFTTLVRRDVDFQIFWSEVSIPTDAVEVPEWLTHYYFDPRKLVEFDPGFKWQGLAYFSTGVFACKRNAITFDEWMQLEALRKLDSKLFGTFFDMPLMNYWVHSKWQRGEMKVAVSDLQHIWGHQGKAELEQDCVGSGWHFPTTIRRPRAAHFCGRKPYIVDSKSYSRPFTIARLEHHRKHHGTLGAWLAVIREESLVIIGKIRRKINNLPWP